MNEGRRDARAALFAILERCAANISSAIVNVCEFERTLAVAHGVHSGRKMCVIHNGVYDTSPENIAEAGQEPPRIVMVARMAPQKDHPTLLQALSALKRLPWQLELIGKGPLEGDVRNLVANYGLSERVTFTGYCDGEQIARRLAKAQVFALITNFEAFPRSILEAMRARLPVVATDVGGIAESVQNGVNGFLVPPKDVHLLTHYLSELIGDAKRRRAMGEAGRSIYLSNFTFEHMYRKTMQMYLRILGRPEHAVPASAMVQSCGA
jgi:glycosyltransferase involved in cell wall biosynthesis